MRNLISELAPSWLTTIKVINLTLFGTGPLYIFLDNQYLIMGCWIVDIKIQGNPYVTINIINSSIDLPLRLICSGEILQGFVMIHFQVTRTSEPVTRMTT